MDILQLKLTLRDIEPTIYRTVEVPAGIKLSDLHTVIQKSFEWETYHLYQFIKGEHRYGPKSGDIDMSEVEDDTSILLGDLLTKVNDKLLYEYDFGDGWMHEVVLQKTLPAEKGAHYPVCVEGASAGPPEDCGGPPGYSELLEELHDPKHVGHETVTEWMGGDFDPGVFDLEMVNRRLLLLKV